MLLTFHAVDSDVSIDAIVVLHTMYKCALNSVVKISIMFARYFVYHAVIVRGRFC